MVPLIWLEAGSPHGLGPAWSLALPIRRMRGNRIDSAENFFDIAIMLNDENLRKLWYEVQEFWNGRDMTMSGSVFST
jgi:hypothetical protein